MDGYYRDLYDDVAQIQHEGPDSFGSGRLIGENLILTARHVVRPGDKSLDSDWKVRLIRERPSEWPKSEWKWHPAKVAWVSEIDDLDLALLVVSGPSPLGPFYRLRIALFAGPGKGPVAGAGFASGSKTDGRIDLSTPTGDLFDQRRSTLTFGIDQSFQPNDPKADWKSFSGSAIFHTAVRDPNDIWVYGVAQQVPGKFTKQLDIAPLARALADNNLVKLFTSAGIDQLDPEDPRRLPAKSEFPDIARLKKYAQNRLADKVDVVMDTRVTLCESYQDLEKLHRSGEKRDKDLTPRGLLQGFAGGGAILLRAPGGFGKSIYLLRMLLEAVDRGWVPFFLGLRGKKLRSEQPSRASCEELFSIASQRGGEWETFRKALDKELGTFVAVDGLNEADNPEDIEKTLAYLATEYGDKLILIATDRMSERAPQFKAQLCTILPLPPEVVTARLLPKLNLARLGDSFKALLGIPFFLALYEKISSAAKHSDGRPLFQTRSEIIIAYFAICSDSGVGANDMLTVGRSIVSKLAPVAFEGYRRGGVSMDYKWFSKELEKIGVPSVPFIQAGLLVKDPQDGVSFRHQLFHDFLAGYHLATKGDPTAANLVTPFWRSANFDDATLKAKSIDALDFAVELVGDKAHELIIEVYDWNYPAAFNLILNVKSESAGSQAESVTALRDALIVLNAEKRFDPFRHTRIEAQKRAASIAAILASPYNAESLSSLDELLGTVREKYYYSGIYTTWKQIFISTAIAPPCDWALLQDLPIIAWTAANSFRRTINDNDPLIDYLYNLYDALQARQPLMDSAIGARWRIAHIFGAANRPQVVDKLFDIVEREGRASGTQWVQSGAIRSLVEISARQAAAEATDRILARLIVMMRTQINSQSRTFEKLREIAVPVKPPSWWAHSYSAVLKEGAKLAGAPKDQKLWNDRLEELTNPSLSLT